MKLISWAFFKSFTDPTQICFTCLISWYFLPETLQELEHVCLTSGSSKELSILTLHLHSLDLFTSFTTLSPDNSSSYLMSQVWYHYFQCEKENKNGVDIAERALYNGARTFKEVWLKCTSQLEWNLTFDLKSSRTPAWNSRHLSNPYPKITQGRFIYSSDPYLKITCNSIRRNIFWLKLESIRILTRQLLTTCGFFVFYKPLILCLPWNTL